MRAAGSRAAAGDRGALSRLESARRSLVVPWSPGGGGGGGGQPAAAAGARLAAREGAVSRRVLGTASSAGRTLSGLSRARVPWSSTGSSAALERPTNGLLRSRLLGAGTRSLSYLSQAAGSSDAGGTLSAPAVPVISPFGAQRVLFSATAESATARNWSESSLVPTLATVARASARTRFPWSSGRTGGHGGHHHRHGSFLLDFHFGYPYTWGAHGWWGPGIHVAYPYAGYYFDYGYPYFDHHGYYGCGFYSGFYVRFGYYRLPYYSFCSGFGLHAYHHHHHHVYTCHLHGPHYYHVRGCSLCYPYLGTYVTHVVEVPEEAVEEAVEEVRELEPEPGGIEEKKAEGPEEGEAAGKLAPGGEQEAGGAGLGPADAEELFFSSLRPAQLSFAMGLLHFREAQYDEAAELFYNATLEDPESRLAKVFLAGALFAIGEYRFAAEYLRLGLEEWESFPRYRWDFRRLYGRPEDFDRHLAALREALELEPQNPDGLLTSAFVLFSAGDLEGAAVVLDALRWSGDPQARVLADRWIRELEDRGGTFPRAEAEPPPDPARDPQAAFLATLGLGELRDLEMR